MSERGRPTDYNSAIADKLCEEVASGKNINTLAGTGAYPSQPTLYKWLKDNDDFLKKYDASRRMRAYARSDRIDDIGRKVEAGMIEPAAAAVIIKAEMWQAGRESPKHFGDKLEIEQTQTVTHNLSLENLDPDSLSTLAAILDQAAASEKPPLPSKANGTKH